MEDEHHFLVDCPVYNSLRASHSSQFQHTQFQNLLVGVKQQLLGVVDLLGVVSLT